MLTDKTNRNRFKATEGNFTMNNETITQENIPSYATVIIVNCGTKKRIAATVYFSNFDEGWPITYLVESGASGYKDWVIVGGYSSLENAIDRYNKL